MCKLPERTLPGAASKPDRRRARDVDDSDLEVVERNPFALRRCGSGHKVVGACYITGLQETWKSRSSIEALLEILNLV